MAAPSQDQEDVAASSAVMGLSLQRELEQKLVGFENKDKVRVLQYE